MLFVLGLSSQSHAAGYCYFVDVGGSVSSSSAKQNPQECVENSVDNPNSIYMYELEFDGKKIIHTIQNGKIITSKYE